MCSTIPNASYDEYLKGAGFAVLPGFITQNRAGTLAAEIHQNIQRCAQELNCTFKEYTYAVNRWLHPSPVTSCVQPLLQEAQAVLATILPSHQPAYSPKCNVIIKSAQVRQATHWHQDITYADQEPYNYTTWLALHDIPASRGALLIQPKSHLWPITEPAIDFWRPDFIDRKAQDQKWVKTALAVPISAGDVIIFESRIWHASLPNRYSQDRFVVAMRWVEHNAIFPKIPPKQPADFGLWTCGAVTEQILRHGLGIMQHQLIDFVELIDLWIAHLACDREPALLEDITSGAFAPAW